MQTKTNDMETLKTANEISESNIENKSKAYFQIAKDAASQIGHLVDSTDFRIKMSAREVISYWRKAEQADCEYALYRTARMAEGWLEKTMTLVNS